MTNSEYDLNGNGKIDLDEREIMLEDRRRKMEDADAKRDAQRRMTWFALAGMVLYPLAILLASLMGYSEAAGLIADIAMRTYLSTIGRNKVGFTVTGTNGNGEPIYIKGLQGVVERNVMRYIFAIQSILDTKDLPEKIRQKAQFAHWYNAISKHRRQLVELSNEEYLNNKKQELKNQQQAQIYGVEEEE